MKQLFTKNTLHWILGLLISTLGICFSTKSDFGLSMIAAAPYILHVKLSEFLPWFSQGTAEYVWEGLILIAMCLVIRRFRPRYLLSFGTAILAGWLIDLWFLPLGGNGAYGTLAARILSFLAGMVITSFGVAFFFRTSLPLEVYELAVTEVAEKFQWSTNKVKYGFDLLMFALALLLSFLLTGSLTGIGIGTVCMTLLNAWIIAFFGKLIDRVEGKQA